MPRPNRVALLGKQAQNHFTCAGIERIARLKTRDVLVESRNAEDWKPLLKLPDLQWKTGYSAKALAYCWQEAGGSFPKSVQAALAASSAGLLNDAELVLAFPEHLVPLPPYSRESSHNDIFVLARAESGYISMTVEGKVLEPFDSKVKDWIKGDKAGGKRTRLQYLLGQLGLSCEQVHETPYQLLHRTASAVIEASRLQEDAALSLDVAGALMLVHCFSSTISPPADGFRQYHEFVSLFGLTAKIGRIVGPVIVNGVPLHFGWVMGEKEYLSR